MRLELFGTQDGILAFTLYRETGGDLWWGLCKFAVAHKFRFEDEKRLTAVSFPWRDRNSVTFHLLLGGTEERQASVVSGLGGVSEPKINFLDLLCDPHAPSRKQSSSYNAGTALR